MRIKGVSNLSSDTCNNGSQTFGEYVKARRELLGKSMRRFANEVGITNIYVRDIELGNRPAPEKYLVKMIEVLQFNEDEVAVFYDLAGKSRNDNYLDLNPYIGKKPIARAALRKARDLDISDKQWQEFIDMISKGINNKGKQDKQDKQE